LKSFPYYHQSYEKDCGPTCLKMIAEFYGKAFTPSQIKNFGIICRKGISLLEIIKAAERIGFNALGLKGSLGFLHQIDLPVILHWDHSHFVVLYEIKDKIYFIADPAKDLLKLKEKEFLIHWKNSEYRSDEGIILMLSPENRHLKNLYK